MPRTVPWAVTPAERHGEQRRGRRFAPPPIQEGSRGIGRRTAGRHAESMRRWNPDDKTGALSSGDMTRHTRPRHSARGGDAHGFETRRVPH